MKLLADSASAGGYADAIFENLVYRYEEPNGMTRWDSPLFTVPWEDETPPFEEIWEAMIGNDGRGKVVKPNQATVLVGRKAGPLQCSCLYSMPAKDTFCRNQPQRQITSMSSTKPPSRSSPRS